MNQRRITLFIVLVVIAGAITYLQSQKVSIVPSKNDGQLASISDADGQYPRAPEFVAPAGFINTSTLSMASLVGKSVVLIDFWTYSCINCQRTLPYLNAWWDKYKDDGLVIVGVHTPEFAFEKKYDNVVKATERYGVKYPVVLDNDYGTWQAYGNQYWPHEYLIDIHGNVVHDHIGEGGYDETEKEIQTLLAERAQVLNRKNSIASGIVTPTGVVSVNPLTSLSPETYFGSARNEFLGNGKQFQAGVQTLSAPKQAVSDRLYLDGVWDVGSEFAQNQRDNDRIIYHYHAKNVYFVGSSDMGVTVKILKDGKPVTAGVGGDVTSGSSVYVKDERLYRLIEDTDYGDHTLEMIIEHPGLKAYTFTFG